MELKELFLLSYNLIKVKSQWTQGAYARGLGRLLETPISVDACQWCSTGAVLRFSGWREDERTLANELFILLCDGIPLMNDLYEACDDKRDIHQVTFSRFNDSHTHEEVMAQWKKVGKKQGWL